MSGWSDFWGKFPNQGSDFGTSDQGFLAGNMFEDTMPEWARMNGQMGDYQQHLFNTSFGGGSGLGYNIDYEQAKAGGADSDRANEEGLENAGMSAAILAAIFGGGSYFGGEGGGGSGISTTGLEGTAQGSGATGTPISTFSGAESYPLASSETMAGWGLGGTEYGNSYAATPYADSVAGATGSGGGGFMDQLTEALGGLGEGEGSGGGGQGGGGNGGGYDSIMDNMLKLSPWTVARRDPQRMAALLAMLRGQKQGGILGY